MVHAANDPKTMEKARLSDAKLQCFKMEKLNSEIFRMD